MFFDPGDCHPPAGAAVLGYGERAVFARFNNWVTDVPKIGDRLPIDLTIAAGALGSTFDDMARDGARGPEKQRGSEGGAGQLLALSS